LNQGKIGPVNRAVLVLLEVHNKTIRVEGQNLGIDMVLVDNDGLDFLVAGEPVSDQVEIGTDGDFGFINKGRNNGLIHG